MLYFFMGMYLTGAVFTFLITMFMVVLGGNSGDLWKPFAWSLIWPITIVMIIRGKW